ncbi:lipocalin family protein [Defluviimonas sp. WL0024]|uniref:Lipocalin family protein n=1 Tax=Albidovulum salinarum TaxID=2984153 RepID=A0ABT2X299_9RHOB|nr:lipocalin family protein [Defluviimonas sp. WL0024]MCU9847760.1 lipocalin family protein [Defluviimonas sp. WL0024]
MPRRALALCLALAACAAPPPPAIGYRYGAALISSSAAFDPARFVDGWHVAAAYGDEARCGPLAETWAPTGPGRYRVTGTACGPSGARALATDAVVTGPGRITRDEAGGPAELWVLWVDADYRVAVIGTPSGRFGRVLSRTPEVRPDLMQAARDVLKFNGYDPAGLQPI